jgi:damage-control phosphatase, subfamily I
MRTYFDCIPCSVRQVLDSVRMITDDETMHERVLRELLGMWQRVDMRQSPPAMAQQIHRFLRQLTGVPDPYLDVKNRYNEFALGLYPELRGRVENSPDPFETAVRLAIAGNIIDFGVNSNVEQGMVYETIMQSLTEPLDCDALKALKQAVAQAEDILFLGDNTGEIVFDRLLIERMPRERLTYVVRGGPILNDALMADAQVAGLTDLVEVIDNGSDAPGTILETCSDAFRKRFEQADLIVAKGQGNFETMNDTPKYAFFLLRPKCTVLARHLNCQLGRLLILRSGKAAAEVP